MRRSFRKLLLWILVSALFGCSNGKLDKRTAAKELETSLDLWTADVFVDTGLVGLNCSYLDEGKQSAKPIDPLHDVDFIVAVKAGYLTVVPVGPESWKVEFTPKGQQFIASHNARPSTYEGQQGCDFKQWALVVAQPKLVSIVDVASDERLAQAVYDYQWVPTELGRELRAEGQTYAKLTQEERDKLALRINYGIGLFGLKLPIPVPSDDISDAIRTKQAFKKHNDGWHDSFE